MAIRVRRVSSGASAGGSGHYGYTSLPTGTVAEDEETEWKQAGRAAILSTRFQLTVAVIIAANALVIGLETEYPSLPYWNAAEHVFLGVFTCELLAKLVFFGPQAYFDCGGLDLSWNLFDLVVVSFGLLDVLLSATHTEENSDADAATVFRIVKLLRILRIFRIVRFLRQLYVLAFGFAVAARAVFWVAFLMGFALYVCSIVIVRTLAKVGAGTVHHDIIQERFGGIGRTMLTLFSIMSVPDLDPYKELLGDFPLFTVFLICFIIFGSFGLMALLTGVIMDCMFEKNEMRKEEERHQMNLNRKLLVRRCEKLYDCIALDDSVASRDQLGEVLPEIADVFTEMGVVFAQGDLECMVEVMVADGRGTIDKAAFRHCILQMAEGVRPMLLMEINYAIAELRSRMDKAFSVLIERQGMELSRMDHLFGAAAQQHRSTEDMDAVKQVVSAGVEALRAQMAELTSAQHTLAQQIPRVSAGLSAGKAASPPCRKRPSVLEGSSGSGRGPMEPLALAGARSGEVDCTAGVRPGRAATLTPAPAPQGHAAAREELEPPGSASAKARSPAADAPRLPPTTTPSPQASIATEIALELRAAASTPEKSSARRARSSEAIRQAPPLDLELERLSSPAAYGAWSSWSDHGSAQVRLAQHGRPPEFGEASREEVADRSHPRSLALRGDGPQSSRSSGDEPLLAAIAVATASSELGHRDEPSLAALAAAAASGELGHRGAWDGHS